jgi:hypothetical protein
MVVYNPTTPADADKIRSSSGVAKSQENIE